MSIEYYYVNDLNRLFNEAVNGRMDDSEHLSAMMLALDNLEAHIQSLAHWRDTALQLSKNHGEAKAEIDRLNEYIKVLENEPIRSKSIIKRLRIQMGMKELEG